MVKTYHSSAHLFYAVMLLPLCQLQWFSKSQHCLVPLQFAVADVVIPVDAMPIHLIFYLMITVNLYHFAEHGEALYIMII